MTGPDTSRMAEARQADADFGLFGGRDPGGDGEQPDEVGEQPDDLYDPEFFRLD